MESDLIVEIRRDHEVIKSLLAEVAESPDDRKLARLIRMITAHETAEQEIVHPLMLDSANGRSVADARLAEEAAASGEIDKLEATGVTDPAFSSSFSEFRRAVLAHAEHEEREEHPILRDTVDAAERRQLADRFRSREQSELDISA